VGSDAGRTPDSRPLRMTFDEILARARDLLQRDKRVSYRGLKRRFDLDDGYLEDLKEELIGALRVAADEDGRFLVWVGEERAAPATGRPDAPAPDAERRQLTVMFCDLVGSTELSEQLDPEELRALVKAYQETSTQAVRRYDGVVVQHLGDGLLVYFGYPRAHEDDPERAVRAALQIIATVGARCFAPSASGPRPLQVRIGIHTGLVVIGEVGAGERRETLALGETPNLAARLQTLAEPDTVVISAATHRLVAGLFECRGLGARALKGLSSPVTAHRVLGETDARSPFDVAVRKGLTPLIGRSAELALLRERWERSTAREAQLVLLSGEAGIGKSRLLESLRASVGPGGSTRVEFRCSPHHQSSAFQPIIDHLQRLLAFEREEAPDARLEKLRQRLGHYRFPSAETLPLVAALLSLPAPLDAPPIALRPSRQRLRLMETIVAWLLEEAEGRPVMSIWEDLHWADPSTLELLQLLLDRAANAPLLVILSFRPELRPTWTARLPTTHLALTRLDPNDIGQLIRGVTAGKTLPERMVQQIVARTDGVPLFVEELTKMLIESDLCREVDGRFELTRPLPEFAIPSTLQDSLTARLDRLAPVREIAQLGAVLGREFSYELIRAVAPFGDAMLMDGLAQLVEAELLYQRGALPRAEFSFKHALVRDTAYQSMLKTKRAQAHTDVAQVLEGQFAEIAEAQPEIVAHHYTEGGAFSQAIDLWLRAGQKAAQRSAYLEAASHLRRGLALLEALPESDRRPRELALQSVLGPALIATQGWAAAETHATYFRTRELSEQLGRTAELFRALRAIVSANIMDGKLREARELAQQLLGLALQSDDPEQLLEAHNTLGFAALYLGDLVVAHEHLARAVALASSTRGFPDEASVPVTAQDARVACRAQSALALWALGFPDQAQAQASEAIRWARALDQPFSVTYALCLAAILHSLRRDWEAAHELANDVVRLSRQHGFSPWWLGNGLSVAGASLVQLGRASEGTAQLEQGIASIRAAGTEMMLPYYLAQLAEAHGSHGRTREGSGALSEAVRIAESREEQLWAAELLRSRGVLALRSNVQARDGEPEACFRSALDQARQQRAKAWELRAAIDLASLWKEQGRPKQARELLAETHGWFTEGWDSPDLRRARRLLDTLT
jgi:predicted ATPase/class 3 adenylate cyclase